MPLRLKDLFKRRVYLVLYSLSQKKFDFGSFGNLKDSWRGRHRQALALMSNIVSVGAKVKRNCLSQKISTSIVFASLWRVPKAKIFGAEIFEMGLTQAFI